MRGDAASVTNIPRLPRTTALRQPHNDNNRAAIHPFVFDIIFNNLSTTHRQRIGAWKRLWFWHTQNIKDATSRDVENKRRFWRPEIHLENNASHLKLCNCGNMKDEFLLGSITNTVLKNCSSRTQSSRFQVIKPIKWSLENKGWGKFTHRFQVYSQLWFVGFGSNEHQLSW